MRYYRGAILLVGVGLALVIPDEASAQVFVGGDDRVASHYVWRGLTRRNAFVWQPDFFLAFRASRFQATAGYWINFEFTRSSLTSPSAIGYGRRIGETSPWIEVQTFSQSWDLALGWTRLMYHNDGPAVGFLTQDRAEVYLRGRLRPGAFTVELNSFIRPTEQQYMYTETRAFWHGKLFPASVNLIRVGAAAGFQSDSPDHFDDSGFTHWEVFVEPQFGFGLIGLPVYAVTSVHVQHNLDDATKITRRPILPATEATVKAWMSFALSVALPL